MSIKRTSTWLAACAGLVLLAHQLDGFAAPEAAPAETQKTKSPKPDNKKADAKTPPAPAADPDPTGGLQSFCKMLPVGQKNAGVKIPSFNNGVPSSLITSHTMTRMDDENMALEIMDIRLYNQSEGRSKDLQVHLKTGNYHMPTQLLSSETRSHVEREDFTLDGDSLVFDTQTQQGKMVGHVQMVIFNSDALTGPKNGDGKSKGAKTATKAEQTTADQANTKADGPTKAGKEENK